MGDLGLWMQYIEFARKDKAYKRLNEIFTQVVRLHPTKPELWIYAANYFMESQADITDARSYMQRGLRFCKNSEQLWIEYAKLETIYIGKIAGRRKILGLDVDRTKKEQEKEDEDMIALPQITAEDVNPSLKKDDGVDEVALQNLASAPILTGAISIAVFDSAMKQFDGKPVVAERFFDMFAEFDQVPSVTRILQHVEDFVRSNAAESVQAASCAFRLPFFGLHPGSPEFPAVLAGALDTLNAAIAQHPSFKRHLSSIAIRQILQSTRFAEHMDAVVKKVLASQLRKFTGFLEETGDGSGDSVSSLAEALKREGKREDARYLVQSSLKRLGTNERLQQLHAALNT